MSGATVSFAVFWSLVFVGTVVLALGRIANRAGRRRSAADRPSSS
jgi:hypothetical protein